MRQTAADYLEAEKIEDLEASLRSSGYQVAREAAVGNEVFDIVAERDGQLQLYEVKARSRLQESIEEVARLRAAARQAGVKGFSVVVVSPPREIDVEVEGLASELTGYFLEALPAAVDRLSADTRVERVRVVEIASVKVRSSGIRVQGRGALEVELNYLGKPGSIGASLDETLSFEFDVDLASDLRLTHVNTIDIDLSDYDEVE